MTTTDATPTEAQPAAKRCIDVLPVRGGKRQALEWLAHSSDFEHGEGFAIITSDRDRTAYAVSAAPDTSGLCFLFTKVGGKGTDKTRESYLIVCDRDGTHGRCECKGWTKWGWCKHADTVESLVTNRWV